MKNSDMTYKLAGALVLGFLIGFTGLGLYSKPLSAPVVEQTGNMASGTQQSAATTSIPNTVDVMSPKAAAPVAPAVQTPTYTPRFVQSNIKVEPRKDRAIVSWNTSVPTQFKFFYDSKPLAGIDSRGISIQSGPITSMMVKMDTFDTKVTLEVTNLLPNTVYNYTIMSTDKQGNIVASPVAAFKTLQ